MSYLIFYYYILSDIAAKFGDIFLAVEGFHSYQQIKANLPFHFMPVDPSVLLSSEGTL